MKNFLLIILCILLSQKLLGQGNTIDKISEHYINISIDSLLMIYENEYKNDRDKIFAEIAENNRFIPLDVEYFNFRLYKPVLVIRTYLSENVIKYNYSIDISNFMNYEPLPYEIAFLNKKNNNLVIYVNNELCLYSERKYFRELSRSFKKAMNDSPDAIMIDSSLSLLTKYSFIIIIKNSKMYTYKKFKRNPIELNNFIIKNLTIEKVRNLSKWSKVFSDTALIITD